ncbi:MAG TPA: hypothetical protein PLP29_07165 [Candidatus Ozemobacteraceae bacterium]|nr:hypothetical protein [Candidatus Ozemobacteraceae bacterium]
MTMMRRYPFANDRVRRSLLVGVIGWVILVAALLAAIRSAGAFEPAAGRTGVLHHVVSHSAPPASCR